MPMFASAEPGKPSRQAALTVPPPAPPPSSAARAASCLASPLLIEPNSREYAKPQAAETKCWFTSGFIATWRPLAKPLRPGRLKPAPKAKEVASPQAASDGEDSKAPPKATESHASF